MAPKLKVFRTHLRFYDMIVAVPSQKAALDAWGASPHLFSQGFAAVETDPRLVAVAVKKPGVVLRRQFGSKGEFQETARTLRAPKASTADAAARRENEQRAAAATERAKRQAATERAREGEGRLHLRPGGLQSYPIAQASGGSSVTRTPSAPFRGKWRIVQMDLWDKEYLDMLGPAHITVQAKGHGEFTFGCVQATMTCDFAKQTAFFTWEGFDEMDPVHGDGSAEITDDGTLEGEIAFHNGDESGFAQRA